MTSATVNTSTSANPLMASSNRHGPFYVDASSLYWQLWYDGTNLCYSSCATMGGTWAAKATAIAGITASNCAVCADETYIHVVYYSGGVLYYRRGTPAGNGTITWDTVQTAVASAPALGLFLSICVSSDDHVCIGYANSSHYPCVTRNSNTTSSATWSTAGGFPAVLQSTAYYEPSIAAGASGAINAVYGYSSVGYFNTVSSGGSVGSPETATLATMINATRCIAVDPTNLTTWVVYCDSSQNIKSRKRTSGGTWDGSETTHAASLGVNGYPGVQVNPTNDYAYVLWTNGAANLYYNIWNGSSWAGAAVLQNESGDGGMAATELNVPQFVQNGQLVAAYKTRTSSAYNVKVVSLALSTTWAMTMSIAASASFSATVLDNHNYVVSTNIAAQASFAVTVIDASPPVASFTADLTELVSPDQTVFIDTSTNSPTSWEWRFGDGRTSTLQNPVHQWNQPGLFTVQMRATNSAGTSAWRTMLITVVNPYVNLYVAIGGEDVLGNLQVGSLRISEGLGMRRTANMTVRNPPVVPEPGMIVEITDRRDWYLPADYLLGGRVWSSEEYSVDEKSGERWFDVEMVSYDNLADMRQVCEVYSPGNAGNIIVAILQNYTDLSPSTSYIDLANSPSIGWSCFNFMTPAQCFDAICQLIGYTWWVDGLRRLHFQPTSGQACPISLTDTSNNWRKMKVRRSMGDYFNCEWVQGADAISDPRPESFKGNSIKTEFILSRPCLMAPTITVNGTSKTVGIYQVETGKDWYWSEGSNAIVQDEAGTILTSAQTLVVTYQYSFPNIRYIENAMEIARMEALSAGYTVIHGRYEVSKRKDSLVTVGQVGDYLVGDLARFGRISEVVVFETDAPIVHAGQTIRIDVSGHGVSGDYLITGVEITQIDKALLRRTVTCQGGAFLTNWTEYFRNLAASGATKNINLGGEGKLLIVRQGSETLTFSDSISVVQS